MNDSQQDLFEENKNLGGVESALLIVDVQKGFINEHTKKLPALIEKLQYDYEHVFILKFINPGYNSRFVKVLKWDKVMKDSEDAELAFKPKEKSTIIEKTTYSCIDDKFLKKLYKIGIKEVHICGINTDVCVLANALALFDTDNITPIVLSKYCATTHGEKRQNETLKVIAHSIGEDQIK